MDMFSEHWWDAYLWNINGIVVWPVWLTLLCIAVVLIIQMIEFSQKRKRNSVLIVACIVGSLLMPFTGEFSGELAFRQACAKDVGLTIYKRVTLPSGMFIPIDPEMGPRGKNNLLIFRNQGYEINESSFTANYSFVLERGEDDVRFSFGKIRNSLDGQLISIFKNYYGYSGFLSEGIRMCGDIFPSLKEELDKQDIYQLQYTFGIEIKD